MRPFLIGVFLQIIAAQPADAVEAASSPLTELKAIHSSGTWTKTALIAATRNCIAANLAKSAQNELMEMHESAGSLPLKLATVRPMRWTAEADGTLAELKQTFIGRLDRNMESPLAWLEMSELDDNEPERSKAVSLQKAVLLGMDDDPAVRAALDLQEDAGYWEDALLTSERWLLQRPTGEVLCNAASLNLLTGDVERAWSLAAQAVAAPDITGRHLSALLQIACQQREWKRVAALFDGRNNLLPDDLAVQASLAVALEETGRDEDAVRAFLRLLRWQGDGRATAVDRFSLRGSSAIPTYYSEPPLGMTDFQLLDSWSGYAYAHRNPQRSRWDTYKPWSIVHLPLNRDEAHAFALIHLMGLRETGAPVTKESLISALADSGLSHLACMLDRPFPDPLRLAKLPDFLARHPDNQPLLAWFVTWWHSTDLREEAPHLSRAIKVFEKSCPELAFTAAMELAKRPGNEQRQGQEDALRLFQVFSNKVTPFALSAASAFRSHSQGWANETDCALAAITFLERAVEELPEKSDIPWMERRGTLVELHLLGTRLHGTEACVRLLNDEARRLASVASGKLSPPIRDDRPNALLMSDQAMAFPNAVFGWSERTLEMLGVFHSGETRRLSPLEAGDWINQLNDPWMRIAALRRCNDLAGAQRAIEARISLPDATIKDWWLAAWLAWEADTIFPDEESLQRAVKLTAERLACASAFPMDAPARMSLDAALLRAVLALKDRPIDMLEAARAAAKRLCQGPLPTTADAEDLRNALETLGFPTEAIHVLKAPIVPNPSEALNRHLGWPDANIYERQLFNGPYHRAGWDPKQKRPPAFRTGQALRELRQMQSGMWELAFVAKDEQVIRECTEAGILDRVIQAVTPPQNATARELLLAGRDLQLLGRTETARRCFEQALALNTRLHEARQHLIFHYLPERVEDASDHLCELPDYMIESLVPELLALCQSDVKDKAEPARQLVIRWLHHLSDKGLQLPAVANIPFQSAIIGQRNHWTELWRMALEFPPLAHFAVARLAEEALRKKQPLTEAVALTKSLLEKESASPPGVPFFVPCIQPRSDALPSEELVTLPPPALILVWDAWQRQAPDDVKRTILPLLQKSHQLAQEEDLDAGASLFFCEPPAFNDAASRFIKNDNARRILTGQAFSDLFFKAGTFDFVTLVWKLRKLPTRLTPLLVSRISDNMQPGNSLDALATQIALDDTLSEKDARVFVKNLRDRLVDPNAERRGVLLRSSFETHRYDGPATRWIRRQAVPQSVHAYLNWLPKLLAQPNTCRTALDLAEEDGLTSRYDWMSSSLPRALDGFEASSPERAVALLDSLSLLADASDLRTWTIEHDPSSSLFARAAACLADDKDPARAALKLVQSRQPQTFGSALMQVWVRHRRGSENERKSAVQAFVTERANDFSQLSPERWPEISVLFLDLRNWERWWTLRDDQDRARLAPLIETHKRYLRYFATRVESASHWEDLSASGYQFIETSAASAICLAEADPSGASRLAAGALGLLAKPAKYPGPKSVNMPDDPTVEWFFSVSQSQAGLSICNAVLDRDDVKGLLSPERQSMLRQRLVEWERRFSEAFQWKSRSSAQLR